MGEEQACSERRKTCPLIHGFGMIAQAIYNTHRMSGPGSPSHQITTGCLRSNCEWWNNGYCSISSMAGRMDDMLTSGLPTIKAGY